MHTTDAYKHTQAKGLSWPEIVRLKIQALQKTLFIKEAIHQKQLPEVST